ncbi:MAG: hypothetical protein HKP58_09405 [Desulfatitalea sp.]|nr:hypothetical protein [Desulfatitalea sp.]NNK00618.1 hypothetical protein [Desulfatitalea sp.]
MSFEIRQMVVNATVKDQAAAPSARVENHFDPEVFKAEILRTCDKLIRQFYQQQQER